MLNKVLKWQKLRFVIIGICNAIISFSVLNIVFYKIHLSKIVASLIATTCALVFSFFLNRLFVFKDKSRKARKQIPAFIVVTISGSIVVLNLVYILSLRILKGNEHYLINSVDSILGIRLSNNFIDINLSTLIGAIVALFWNYNGYRLFVFKKVDNDATKEIKITV